LGSGSQKYDRLEYVDHLYNVFYDFVGSPPAIRNISGGGAADRQSYWFRTYGHKELAKIISPFYQFDSSLGKLLKIVPNDIDQWFNECVLAYWFMVPPSYARGRFLMVLFPVIILKLII
jgi:hypothetical protein